VKSLKRPIDPKFAKAIEGMPKTVNMLAVTDPSEYMPEIICNLPFFVQGMAMLGRSEQNFPLAGLRIDIARKDIPKPADLRKYLFPSSAVISVDDEGLLMQTRDAVPNLSAGSSAPVAVALLLPAVQSARTAARRSQSSNNLKQIMLALHNYHDANGRFPAPAITDGEGKPLLSWRVAILPYLEQNALYEEFKLDEAWDSPHNKALIAKMPAVFASPNVQPPTPFSTFYQTFVGPGALYEKAGEGTKITEITDGTSNTVAVAEAGRAVVWSKPEDISYDPEKTVPQLGGVGFPGGANVGFCDGSVRFLSSMLEPDVFRGLITKAGGEVVNID
jgi:prepilin-type processing-associated H-X9-DG protein